MLSVRKDTKVFDVKFYAVWLSGQAGPAPHTPLRRSAHPAGSAACGAQAEVEGEEEADRERSRLMQRWNSRGSGEVSGVLCLNLRQEASASQQSGAPEASLARQPGDRVEELSRNRFCYPPMKCCI